MNFLLQFVRLFAFPVNLAGLQIPLISLGIIFALAFVFQRYFRKLNSCLKGVRTDIGSALDYVNGFGGKISGEQFEELDEEMKRHPSIRDQWDEFCGTLIQDRDRNDKVLFFATCSSSEFLHLDAVLDQDLEWYSSVPGVLTGLGLLGTFLALFTGLICLHVNPDGQVTGIEDFINNLSGKFLSSIIGLGLSILFLWWEKRKRSDIERTCLRLQRKLDRIVPRKLQERLLMKIGKDLEDQSTAFKSFNSDLSGHLKESFRESMGPTMERMVDAIDQLLKVTEHIQEQKQESATTAMSEMIAEFKNSITGSANSEIAKLSETLTQTAQFTEGMNERMTSLLSNVDQMLQSQQQQTKEHSESMKTAVDHMMQQVEGSSTVQMEGMQSMVNDLMTMGTQWSQQMSSQMEDSLRAQQKVSEESVASLISKVEDWNNQISGQMISVLNEASSSGSNLREANGALQSTLERFEQALRQNSEFTNRMNEVTQTLVQAGKVLSTTSESLNSAQHSSERTLADLTAQMNRYEKSLQDVQGLWKRQEEMYTMLDQSLGRTLSNLNQSFQEYAAATKSSLGEYLSEFDKHLADAASKLHATVADLEEQLEELTDVIEKSVSSVPSASHSAIRGMISVIPE